MFKLKLISGFMIATLTCASAFAQYIWVDEKGNKQFSDTPPPASTPKNRIIKAPGLSAARPAEPSEAASASKDAASTQQKPMTTSARNEDFNKRRAEQAEKDKKATEDQQAAAEKQKNCERAKSYQKVLESGQRVASTDKNGERSFLTDAQREKESADVKKALAGCQ